MKNMIQYYLQNCKIVKILSLKFLFCELLIILDILPCVEHHHKATGVICHVESAVTYGLNWAKDMKMMA